MLRHPGPLLWQCQGISEPVCCTVVQLQGIEQQGLPWRESEGTPGSEHLLCARHCVSFGGEGAESNQLQGICGQWRKQTQKPVLECKGEDTVITGKDLQRGKGFLPAREEEPKMQHLRAGSQPSGEPIDVRLEKGRWGGCLRFLLSSLLLLTEIPHIYNDNMQTFLPAGE